jgi:hypothetical protein
MVCMAVRIQDRSGDQAALIDPVEDVAGVEPGVDHQAIPTVLQMDEVTVFRE